jgi:signal transduction histidine kinase
MRSASSDRSILQNVDRDGPAHVVEAVHGLPAHASPLVQARTLARALGECLGADEVVIALPGETAVAWSATGSATDAPGCTPADEGLEVTVRPVKAAKLLQHQPELRIAVRLLLDDIHAQLATARAAEADARAAAALADAELRAAGEMEQLRYQLERDLHDGAQHHMVALQMALALVEHHVDSGNPQEAARHLDRLRTLIAGTEEVLHTTATGLLSLPLADRGLAAALTTELSTVDGMVLVVEPRLKDRRFPNEVEAALYLSCLEAVSNAYKHAPGASVTVRLWASARGVHFEVADDGPGFDPSGREPLAQLAARMASVGGALRVESRPGAGTRVTAFVAI